MGFKTQPHVPDDSPPSPRRVGNGTRLGVLVRGGGCALKSAENIERVLFDKTGTLTLGEPQVLHAFFASTNTTCNVPDVENVVSQLVHAVEQQSSHPLAAAVVAYVQKQLVDNAKSALSAPISTVDSFEEEPGCGVRATVANGQYSVRVGSRTWAFRDGGSHETSLLTAQETALIDNMEREQGLTVVVAVVNDSMVAVYGLQDAIRPRGCGGCGLCAKHAWARGGHGDRRLA